LAGPFDGSIWRVNLEDLFGGSTKVWRVRSKGKQVENSRRKKEKGKAIAKKG
jgi:hypothetical protein